MPDLTIKPVAAAGNKLILQDQAGGSVLTTGDSGVTAGSTILATKTGTETLTNKTLTTPTLNTPTIANMTNCTFPAGHIIKLYTKQFRDRQAFTNTGPNSDSNYITVGHGASGTSGDPLEITTDTPASATSKYLITANVYQSRSQDGMLAFRIMYNNNGTHTAIVLGRSSGSQTRATFGRGHPSTLGNSGNYGLAHSGITFLWEPNSAVDQTIYCKGCNYNTNANHVNCDDSNANTDHVINTISTLTVQEIAG